MDGREGQHFRENMGEVKKGRYSSGYRKGDCVFCKPVPPSISPWEVWYRDQGGNPKSRALKLSKIPLLQVAKKHPSHRTIRDFGNQESGTTSVANDEWRANFHPLSLQDLHTWYGRGPETTGNESLPSSQQEGELEGSLGGSLN